jgi:hypothetical protein
VKFLRTAAHRVNRSQAVQKVNVMIDRKGR